LINTIFSLFFHTKTRNKEYFSFQNHIVFIKFNSTNWQRITIYAHCPTLEKIYYQNKKRQILDNRVIKKKIKKNKKSIFYWNQILNNFTLPKINVQWKPTKHKLQHTFISSYIFMHTISKRIKEFADKHLILFKSHSATTDRFFYYHMLVELNCVTY
jgi:hypothetical protein